ncbi:hypothetical protein [Runella limosa]|uniref:hypothetical protein n=1 Tax=Runella limosa TaxID=370978 RepID=UPI000423EECF|nr:hypothetical protein [Runella limosa]
MDNHEYRINFKWGTLPMSMMEENYQDWGAGKCRILLNFVSIISTTVVNHLNSQIDEK